MQLEYKGVTYPLAFNQLTLEQSAKMGGTGILEGSDAIATYAIIYASMLSGAFVNRKDFTGSFVFDLSFADVVSMVDDIFKTAEGKEKIAEICSEYLEMAGFKKNIPETISEKKTSGRKAKAKT